MLLLLDHWPRLTLKYKFPMYGVILKFSWTYKYSLEVRDSKNPLKHPSVNLQSKIFWKIPQTPFHVVTEGFHSDLRIPSAKNFVITRYKAFHDFLFNRPNPWIFQQLSLRYSRNPSRYLKWKWPRDQLNF